MTFDRQLGPRAPRLVALKMVFPCVMLRTLLPLENVTSLGPSILSQEQKALISPLKAGSTKSCFLIHLVINCLESMIRILPER